ncbi:MAG: reprolysin-like metallopeptidase, partial [Cellvibrionaceae bacterium]
MQLLKRMFAVGLALSVSQFAVASSLWQDIEHTDGSSTSALKADNQSLMAKAYNSRRLLINDLDSLRAQLLENESLDLELPLPDGQIVIYHLEHSPIAEQGLLDKFPEIKTFRGVDVDNPANSGRFDISPLGFRGMFRHEGESIFLDPQYLGNTEIYLSYLSKNALPLERRPADQVVYGELSQSLDKAVDRTADRVFAKGNSDGNNRTYRLAVAATGEYSAVFGGTVMGAMSAITTAINRVNEVYQNDLGITLQLIANNDSIIYTNAGTDPYLNTSGDLNNNQTNIDAVIGSANYDIGHLFSTGAGGIAQLGSVCGSGKARGLTGLSNPTGDRFYIDFVAHEIGHQFGGNHTFNGSTSNCSGANRNASTAFEPGSGSTIMAYAGICGAENLQSNSDPYFHAGSLEEINDFIESGNGASCGTSSAQVNAIPDVSAGPDVTIPANTPFMLTGSATDGDPGDTLSYVWEQLDAGTASTSTATMVDNGNRAIFRSFTPVNTATRYFPRLEDVIDGSLVLGEAYPTTNRTLNFRLTARDGSGATAFENRVVTVTTAAGPFNVTFPESGDTWTQGTSLVTWDVANTDQAPVSCSLVNIDYSGDGGSTFPVRLSTNVTNDGSQSVTTPTTVTSQGRV